MSPRTVLRAALTVALLASTLAAVPAAADEPEQSTGPLDLPARGVETSPPTAAAAPDGQVVTIEGAGWGHGIGLSQYGAQARALEGASAAEIIGTYYTNDATIGTLGVDVIPDPGPIFTNVASDRMTTTLTVATGPSGPETGMVLARIGSGDPTVTLFDGDTAVVTDTTFTSGAVGGCVVTLTIGGVESVWDEGSCDFDVALTPGDQIPTDLVSATDCRTAYCTFGTGTALHIVDNGSPQRTVADPWPGFDIVVESTVDEYTRGIAEVPFSWEPAALEAQAIAARSYGATWAFEKDHRAEGCFCDLKNHSQYQVYGGWIGDRQMADRWDAAALATAGKVVTDPAALATHGKVVRAFYTSSNGGASENNEDIWGGEALPYLRSIPDPYSTVYPNPLRSWTKEIPLDVFSAKLGFEIVTDVRISGRFVSGTPKTIEVTGYNGGVVSTACFGAYEPCVAPEDVRTGEGAGELFDQIFGLYSPHITDLWMPGHSATVDRWFGPDRYATAADVSRHGFPAGADTVYIATGENFPDAIAAAPLATVDPGPILLVRTTAIPAATSAEVARLRPAKIVILGGTGVVSGTVADKLAAYAPVTRLAGPDRYVTAAQIATAAYPGGTDTVFIAVGTTHADALVAAPAAAANRGPLLLTQRSALPEPTRNALTRLKPSKIVVVGGGTSVSSSVVEALNAYTDGVVTTIAGSDRYETSALVAAQSFTNPDIAFVATGTTFPDALAAGAVAGGASAPVLLVQPDALPGSVAEQLVLLDPADVVVLGGPNAVSDDVAAAIHALFN